MFKIVIANQCGCYKRSDIQNNQTFTSKDDALMKAIEIKDKMNTEFCKKHTFEVQEIYNNFMISFYDENKQPCCGNGCCS